MNHNLPPSTDDFIQQMAYIDENIKELTSLYIYSTPIQDRVKHFFNLYLLEVEDLLEKNKPGNVIPMLPKVYIGTKVSVLYDEDNEVEEYIICFPEQSEPDEGYISFLSPLGRQLLLKSIGEKVAIHIPSGELAVTIKDISYAGNLLEGYKNKKEA